jgi:hypothetical protein
VNRTERVYEALTAVMAETDGSLHRATNLVTQVPQDERQTFKGSERVIVDHVF